MIEKEKRKPFYQVLKKLSAPIVKEKGYVNVICVGKRKRGI